MGKGFWGGAVDARMVSVRLIDPDPKQVRAGVDRKSVDELAESIRKLGVVVPLLVLPVGHRLRLIAGHRRLMAAKIAGLKEVPVIIKGNGDDGALAGQLVENLAREDMPAADVAAGLLRLQKQMGCSQAVLAKVVGRSEAWVSQMLGYSKLSPELRALVDEGQVGMAVARILDSIRNRDAASAALAEARLNGMTEAQALAWRNNATHADALAAGEKPSPGVPVEVDPDRHKGVCGVCSKRRSFAAMTSVWVCADCIAAPSKPSA